MTVTKLIRKRVEKPWGRTDLPAMFRADHDTGQPLGEIWFEHPAGEDVDLLVKYLFTSEKLSIQVHPDDEAARQAGHKRGKDEAWVVLQADSGATIGIGLRERVTRDRLRQAALDGSIEDLVDWRPAAAGDIYYSPAGTVHALGPGLTLIEIQQNTDLTYRLYDYGRPRELHLDAGVRASRPQPYVAAACPYDFEEGREILADGQAFVLERWRSAVSATLTPAEDRPIWLVPVAGRGGIEGEALEPGDVWLATGPATLSLEPRSELLVAYAGSRVQDRLIN